MRLDSKPPLYGLVLAGGRSTRMGKDKSILHYHGKSQVEHCVELLSYFCKKVFISNRKEQSNLSEHKKFVQIHDDYHDIGPLGGILSAMEKFPNVAWLILACDLPCVRQKTIRALIKNRNPEKMMTGYANAAGNFPEPLCAIYEPKIYVYLLQSLRRGCQCPSGILASLDVELLNQEDETSLFNANSPEECYNAPVSLG